MTSPTSCIENVLERNKVAKGGQEFSADPETEPAIGSRELFPDLKAKAYLAHCSISPVSNPVRERIRAVADSYAQYGAKAFEIWLPLRTELRARLGRFFSCSQDAFALLPNTTQGVLTTALCFPWKRGDKIICFRGEFPANVTPWQRAAELYDLEIVYIDLPRAEASDDAVMLADLEKALRKGARLAAASAVQFQTGRLMPLKEMADLCHKHDAAIFTDLIQAAGAAEIDLGGWDVDFAACGSHKWLMGIEGAGFLYIKPGWEQKLRPVMAGWLSHEDALSFLSAPESLLRYDRPIRRAADFPELGTGNTMGYAALEASTAIIEKLGISNISAHIGKYLDLLELRLKDLGFTSLRGKRGSGILSVIPPSGLAVTDICRKLGERGIVCSTPDGLLRFAPHWPNPLGEVPLIEEAVREELRSGS